MVQATVSKNKESEREANACPRDRWGGDGVGGKQRTSVAGKCGEV